MGVVSPVGSGREAFWRNLTAGRSGISTVTLFDTSAMPVRIGGQVTDLDVEELVQRFPELAAERDRKIPLGFAAASEAVTAAGVCSGDLAAARLFVGVGLEMLHLGDLTPFAGEKDLVGTLARSKLATPAATPVQTPLDRLGVLLRERFGIGGACCTNGSACAAGAQVVGQAMQSIQDGLCDVAVAGAADSMLNPLGLGGFSLLRVLATGDGSPERACRPFDASRQGTVLGEGAAFLVLEELTRARARNASVLAEVLGYGCSMDGFAVSDPDPAGRGAAVSMRKAIRDARLTPDDVDCVSAHGTGTVKNDIVETAAIKEVLGARARIVPVHAVKSMTGHMIAASGAVEAVAAVLTLGRGVVPPTINLDRPDPECDLDYVPNASRPFAGRTVLSNSFGFGGQNATLIFGRPSWPSVN
ncbi:MAG: beta-ketoacyl-[acyl-carrier-protein] synthase family protein [Phycisphaerae bacterium]